MLVLIGEERQRHGLEPGPVSHLQWNPAQKNGAIKAKVSNNPHVTDSPPQRSLPAPCVFACRTPRQDDAGLNPRLNWIDR